MKSLLFANGDLNDGPVVQEALLSYDNAYAADGGCRHAIALNIPLTAIIGDLDSLPSKPSCPTVQFPKEKNETDLELAIAYAFKNATTSLTIIGAMGGRFDHALANTYLLMQNVTRDIQVVANAQTVRAFPPGKHTLSAKPGTLLSLLPLGGAVSGVTLTGCHYPLTEANLAADEIRGISNIVTDNPLTLTFTAGTLLLTQTSTQ